MNYLRTAMLLAGLTALFMGVGYLIGGEGGAIIALLVAAAMNLVTYWNADKLVLSMHGAQEVDQHGSRDAAPSMVPNCSSEVLASRSLCPNKSTPGRSKFASGNRRAATSLDMAPMT